MQSSNRAKSRSAVIAAGSSILLLLGMFLVYGRPAKALPPQGGYTVQQGPGGTIQGKLLWVGKPMHPRRVTVTQDRSACGKVKELWTVHVEKGGVADAVVWLDDITHGKAFSFPKPVLDQKGCMFVPPVVLMKPGKLEVENSDDATHNVHIYARYNRPSNHMMAPGASPLHLTLMRPEDILVRCDVHTWMQGYIVVAKNPYYAVSGSGGSFTLTEVPPGTYHLKVWQHKIGTKDQQVTVQAGKTTTVTFKLGS
jgi:plastocyanin